MPGQPNPPPEQQRKRFEDEVKKRIDDGELDPANADKVRGPPLAR
jgi:hypothetical protein